MAYNLKNKLVVAVSSRALFDLEEENRRLKKLVADLSLDKMALEEVLKKI